MRCDECRFWKQIGTSQSGDCRRHAPKPLVGKYTESTDFETYWPETLKGEWCGEFQPTDQPAEGE